MSINFQSEDEVKEFIKNLGIEYRFGCYSEKRGEVCHLLGDYLESIDKNYEKAAKLYKITCDDYKYPKSCTKFATYALLGRGLRECDPRSAYDYFEKGCNLNDPNSCLHQGLLLITNQDKRDIKPDVHKGIEALNKSCNGENANACYFLSGLYISGVKKAVQNDKKDGKVEYELEKNMKQAFKYASKGCELGNIYSCANLSQMYQKGEGVEKNQELAKKYKEMALEMQRDIKEGKTLSFQQGLK